MKTMLPVDYQLMMENKYSKANIRKYVLKDISECEEILNKLFVCEMTIRKWCEDNHYESKKEMLKVILEEDFDLQGMLLDILSVTLTQQYQMELTSAVGMALGFMPWSEDKYEPSVIIKRCGEMFYHLAACDLINMSPAFRSETNTVLVSNKYTIGGDTAKYIAMSRFTPPMVCVPEPIQSCSDSGYLTKQQFSVLKRKHKHKHPINTYALNLWNATPLTLDIEYLQAVEDEISSSEVCETTKKNFERLQTSTNEICMEIVRSGNKFFETSFYCGRGRTYARGYHINSQGNSHRKAMINFHDAAPICVEDKYADLLK